jgi:hypothetical protein
VRRALHVARALGLIEMQPSALRVILARSSASSTTPPTKGGARGNFSLALTG